MLKCWERPERHSLVEKLAAYHAIMTSIDSPRQIKMLVENSIERTNKATDVLKYDHHFEDGNIENKEFWNKNTDAVNKLKSTTLKIY